MKMRTTWTAVLMAIIVFCAAQSSRAQHEDKAKAANLSRASQAALDKLYRSVPLAKFLGTKAQAILVFPSVQKASLGTGGQYGEGTLLRNGTPAAYYKTTGASLGLQAGDQQFGYAMFFMNAKALHAFVNAGEFEVGVGPSVLLIDENRAKNARTTIMPDDIYAFIFGEKGLIAGLGIQGYTITKITP
jgi:lipid-binding SYLF domain-containing protein